MKQGKQRTHRILLAASVLAALASGSASATEETPVYSLDAVVVTATRTENEVKNVPASTQVITAEDIKKSGAHDLRMVLQDYANIFQKSRTRGGGHDVIIRGMDTDKSLIMINGRRVSNEADSSGLGNAMALDRINLSNVEKIEVVKGPSSALYGSEAMGGVINIITKPSSELSLSTGLEHTSDDTSHWWHVDSGRMGKFSATFDVRFNKINRSMEETDTSSNNYGTAQTYNGSLNYYFNDNNYLNVYMDYYSQHLKNDTGTPALKSKPVPMGTMILNGQVMLDGSGSRDYKQKNYGISWNAKTERNQWQLQAYASRFDWSDRSNTKVLQAIPGSDPMSQRAYVSYVNSQLNTSDFNIDSNKMWAIEGRDTMTLNDHHRLTFGGEYVRNTIRGTGLGANGDSPYSITENGVTKTGTEKELTTYSFYVQDEMTYGKWFIVPAVRYDHNSFYGSHTSPKLGITYNATDHFRVKANYGKGFKAPSVMQLFYDLDRRMGSSNVHLIGNPNLKPEQSTSWDLGVEAEFGKGYGSLTYFDNDVDNLITSKFLYIEGNGHNLYQYTNANTARIKGVENTLGYRFNDVLDFKVNSTWLSAKDTTNHTDLTQRAKLTQIYALTYDDHKDKGWTARLWDQLDYKYLSAVTNEKKSYHLLNFTLTRKINKDTRVYGSVMNIFDKEDSACDLDGRWWSIGWEHRF